MIAAAVNRRRFLRAMSALWQQKTLVFLLCVVTSSSVNDVTTGDAAMTEDVTTTTTTTSTTTTGNDTRPLYIATLVPITGMPGWFEHVAAAMEIAVEDLNALNNLLPGYRLELVIANTQVSQVCPSNVYEFPIRSDSHYILVWVREQGEC